MGKKTPPWPDYPKWTTARFWAFVRSNLRRAHGHWPPFREAKLEGRKNKPAETPGRHKYEHQCEHCQEWFPEKMIEMDHRVPVGTLTKHDDLPGFVMRLYAPASEYRKLCIPCHQAVTNEERQGKT